MRTPATTALAVAPERRTGGAAARSGIPPGESPFAALLESDRARTAPAEGPKTDKPRTERRDAEASASAAKAEPASADAPQPVAEPVPEAEAAPATEVVEAVPLAVAVAVAEAPVAPVPVVAPTTPVDAADVAPAVPAPTTTVAPADAAAPVAPAPGDAEPVPAATAPVTDGEPTDTEAQPTTGEGEPVEGAEPGKDKSNAGGNGKGREPDTGAKAEKGPAATASPVAHAATAAERGQAQSGQGSATAEAVHAAQAAAADKPAAAPAAPAPVVGSAAAPATPQAAPALDVRGAVPLHHAARAVEVALEIAARRGITHAKLELHPAELGAIELHLRHSASGMTARLVADSAEAAAVLQQQSDDLRRSLEAAGITALTLDISARGDEQRRAFAGSAGDGTSDRSGRDDRGAGKDGDADTTTPTQHVRAQVPLGGGALLDVIA